MDKEIKDIKAFTLVEILVAVVVLAVALVPLIGVFTTGAKQAGVAQKITIATNLGQDLMEEIKSKKFDENPLNPTNPSKLGPERRENRGSTWYPFDDVDDYNGYTDSPPEEIDGTPMSEYQDYSRSVVVVYVNTDDFDTVSSVITKFKRVTLTVTWDQGTQSVSLITVKGNY